MGIKKVISILACATPLAVSAQGVQNHYDVCNGILVDGVLKTYQNTQNIKSKVALKKWLCSHDSGQGGGGGNLELDVIGIFTLGGGGQGANQWKREHCQGSDSSYEGSKSSHILIQHTNTAVVNAWSQCIKDVRPENLVCYATQTNDSLLMTLDLQHGIGNITNLDIAATNMLALNQIPQRLRPGKKNLRFQLESKSQEAFFDMNGEADHIDVSCSYTVPPEPKSEDGVAGCDQFRQQAFDSGRISFRDYEYLTAHNEVPLFDDKNGSYIGRYPCELF